MRSTSWMHSFELCSHFKHSNIHRILGQDKIRKSSSYYPTHKRAWGITVRVVKFSQIVPASSYLWSLPVCCTKRILKKIANHIIQFLNRCSACYIVCYIVLVIGFKYPCGTSILIGMVIISRVFSPRCLRDVIAVANSRYRTCLLVHLKLEKAQSRIELLAIYFHERLELSVTELELVIGTHLQQI